MERVRLVSRISVLICKEMKDIITFPSADGSRETADEDSLSGHRGKATDRCQKLSRPWLFLCPARLSCPSGIRGGKIIICRCNVVRTKNRI